MNAILYGRPAVVVMLAGLIFALASAFTGAVAHAADPVRVSVDDVALDITGAIDPYVRADGVLKISTAPDAEGIVRRIEVRSKREEGTSYWAVFSLANTSDEQLDRLIVAPHYRMVGSGFIWPDLDNTRITNITPSEGFTLDRQRDSSSDVFLITLDPGAVITLIAEQNTQTLPKLFLWEPDAYKDTANSYTLYQGIVLGISGLLAIFLTILFVVKGSAMFPATAALAWGVLAYICVDFGFWNKIISTPEANDPFWRAGTEVFLAASLLIFVFAYLNLNRWHSRFVYLMFAWILMLIILMGVAVFEPGVAAGLARFSTAAVVLLGVALIPFLVFNRFDRAIMLVPTWLLLLAWVGAAGLAVGGDIANDIVQPALSGGLVLIVLLLSFTVLQHAFAGGAFAQGLVSDAERSALALAGSGDVTWDWDIARDQITLSDNILPMLNADRRILQSQPANWKKLVHPNDRDRFDVTLAAVIEHKRGKVSQDFRLRASDGHYHWFKLRARPMLNLAGEVERCVGTLVDITEQKKSEERLLHDSIRDHLTGLESREVFVQRLETVIALGKRENNLRPTVFFVDVDDFQQINVEHGYAVGDTILLSLSRRLSRLLKPGDSLARMSADQFALMLVSGSESKQIAAYADAIRTTMKAPIEFADDALHLSASIGLAIWTNQNEDAEKLLRHAELASVEAKRLGGDRTITFETSMRPSKDGSIVMHEDMKLAIQRNEFKVLYQPIVSLEQRATAGYEALVRWEHPRLGTLMPSEFIPVAERTGLIHQIGVLVLERASRDFANIFQKTGQSVFVSVNVSSRELLKTDFVTDIANVLQTSGLRPDMLKIEVTESMVMQNPEHATQILQRIKALGTGVSLDDFGTGYSSLSYLLRFPFDTIKIDKSFIQARSQYERLVILNSIIGLGQSLNQTIIAEGVEYESDVTDLIQLGCQYAQGFLFGEPARIEDVEKSVLEEYSQS